MTVKTAPSSSGCDAGNCTLPGHLPDRPDHAGHCSAGLHWGEFPAAEPVLCSRACGLLLGFLGEEICFSQYLFRAHNACGSRLGSEKTKQTPEDPRNGAEASESNRCLLKQAAVDRNGGSEYGVQREAREHLRWWGMMGSLWRHMMKCLLRGGVWAWTLQMALKRWYTPTFCLESKEWTRWMNFPSGPPLFFIIIVSLPPALDCALGSTYCLSSAAKTGEFHPNKQPVDSHTKMLSRKNLIFEMRFKGYL